MRPWRVLLAMGVLGAAGLGSAAAQKPGGMLRSSNSANPPSLSIHEEVAVCTIQSVMGGFDNLVAPPASRAVGEATPTSSAQPSRAPPCSPPY